MLLLVIVVIVSMGVTLHAFGKLENDRKEANENEELTKSKRG